MPLRAHLSISSISFAVGFGCLWICLHSAGFYPLSVIPQIGEVSAQSVAWMHLAYAAAVVAGALIIILIARHFLHTARISMSVCIVLGICGLAGHLLLLLADPIRAGFEAQAVIGSILTACFIVLSVMVWGIYSTQDQPSHMLIHVIAAFLVSSVTVAVLYAFDVSQDVLMVICPPLSAICAGIYRQTQQSAISITDPAIGIKENTATISTGSLRKVPWRMVVPALFLVYFCVIFVRLLVTDFTGDADISGKALAGAICTAIFIVVLLITHRSMVFENKLTATFVFLVLVYMGALVAMLVLNGSENFYVRRILIASEHCVDVFVWITLAYSVIVKHVSPFKAFSFYLVLVVALPWVLSFDLFYLTHFNSVIEGNAILVPAVAIASFIAAAGVIIFLLTRLFGKNGMTANPADAGWRRDVVEDILSTGDLTPREVEVAIRVYHGYSAKRIGDDLGLTEQTVKTYTSRIYHKIGVHSKQEFIAHVEEQAQASTQE